MKRAQFSRICTIGLPCVSYVIPMRQLLLILAACTQGLFAQSAMDDLQPPRAAGCAAKHLQISRSQPASVADPSVDATYYRLVLRLDIPSSILHGVVTLQARVAADSTRDLMLDLSQSMKLDSAQMNGQRLVATRFPQSLTLTLPRTYRTGEMITVEIAYHGTPSPTGFGSFYFGTYSGSPWIWSLSQPYGARDWWPCRDHPLDKADSVDILVTCPTGLHVGSNGKLMEVHDNGDGTSTHFWSERYPIATYLVSIAVCNYAVFSNWYAY